MLRNYENSSLGNWILARNFLKILFWPLFLRVDCSQSQDASIKPLCRVCSQKLKFLWPTVAFFGFSEYNRYVDCSMWLVPCSQVPEISTSCIHTDLDYYAKNVLFQGSVGTHRLLPSCMHPRPGIFFRAWSLEQYLETPGRSIPKNELYRRVSTSATTCSKIRV